MIKLLGIVLIAAGFALRLNALAVVTVAGIATAWLAGFELREIIRMLGQSFVDNRALTLPVILLVPAIGLLERHGLQQHVASLMRRVGRLKTPGVAVQHSASSKTPGVAVQHPVSYTPGRVLWLYQLIRELTSTVGMSIGNHASMVRPLVVPMAEEAARAGDGLDDEASQQIRAHAAAAENVGNFFADDLLVAIGALLLIKSFFDSAGVPVSLSDIKLWSTPTAVWVLFVGWWRFRTLDRRIRAGRNREARRP